MLSIITGTLNRIDHLKNVVENTVLSSDKIELVLIDGGSTDGTIDYIKNLKNERINLIEFGKRSYYWDFMNLGIKNSKFEYICQWNDDIILENTWDEVISEIEDGFDLYLFSWLEGNSGYVIYENENELVLNYGIYRKKVFREIGLYNNSYKYYYCDGDMSYRAKSFGYNYKKLYNIKCRPLTSHGEKKAYTENETLEKQNYFTLLEKYRNKILPENIELL
jgi:glycosyltransferase involved in cell wall biosynthesis